jgi:hypothetical protein
MTMQAVNPMPGVVMPQSEKIQRRFGLFPVRIGANVIHRLGIAMPLETPEHDARQYGKRATKVRSRVRPAKPRYEMGLVKQNGLDVEVPVKAFAGCPVYLEVQPWDRLEDELRPHVKWACNHPDCVGKRYETAEALQQDHEPNHILEQEATQAPNGQAHMYFGVIELAGKDAVAEVKDEKTGKIVQRAIPAEVPTIMIVSNEE